MEIAYDKIPHFKQGDVLEVVGNEMFELVVAKKALTVRNHEYDPDYPEKEGYCYWYGPVYKRMKGSSDQGTLVFIKLTLNSISMGVQKLEKEKSFCVDYPYVERVYGLYDVKAKNDTDENPMLFKALLCEYIEGSSMYVYYSSDDFREYGAGINNRDEEISLFRYFLQLMFAVKFYTEQSYLDAYAHRDLKPDNVIVCKNEKRIVIIDFDFAHVPDLKSMFKTPQTDFTMPLNTKCTSVQKDIHTLGWTFLFCLTGERYSKEQKEKNDGYFGFPRDFILERAEKYLEEDYSRLININKKMIADPASDNAYTSIDELIRDYKKFLISYVKDEDELKGVLAGTELLLQGSDDMGKDDRYRVRMWLRPEKGMDLRRTLSNFETAYYSFDKAVHNFQSAHLCFQNVYGEIYYLVLDENVKTDADKSIGAVKTGDTFWRGGHKMSVEVKKTGYTGVKRKEAVKEIKWFLTRLKKQHR